MLLQTNRLCISDIQNAITGTLYFTRHNEYGKDVRYSLTHNQLQILNNCLGFTVRDGRVIGMTDKELADSYNDACFLNSVEKGYTSKTGKFLVLNTFTNVEYLIGFREGIQVCHYLTSVQVSVLLAALGLRYDGKAITGCPDTESLWKPAPNAIKQLLDFVIVIIRKTRFLLK